MYKKKFAKWRWNKYGHQTTAGKRKCVRNRHAQETQRLIALHHETSLDRLIESALKEVRDFAIPILGKSPDCRTDSDWGGLLYLNLFFACDCLQSIMRRALERSHSSGNLQFALRVLRHFSFQYLMSIGAEQLCNEMIKPQTKLHHNQPPPFIFIPSTFYHLVNIEPESLSRYLLQGASLFEDLLEWHGVYNNPVHRRRSLACQSRASGG